MTRDLSTSAPSTSGALPSGWPDTSVSVRLRRGANGALRVEGVLCSAPVWFRWDGVTLWLVGSGASPVGEDHIRVRVDVGEGVSATVRSVAATMIYAARGAGTRWDTVIHVADGARLDWRPEPVILTEHARHAASTTVHATAGSEVVLDEVLVLGRADEPAGTLRSTLDVRLDDTPAVLTSVDTSLPGWSGPAGIAHHRVVANRLVLGATQRGDGDQDVDGGSATGDQLSPVVVLDPTPGCRLAMAVASEVSEAMRTVDVTLPSPPPPAQ